MRKFNNKSDVIHGVEIQINNTMTMVNKWIMMLIIVLNSNHILYNGGTKKTTSELAYNMNSYKSNEELDSGTL